MLRTILTFTVVSVAFAVGSHLAGRVGSIVAGVAAFAVCLHDSERLEHSRGARGYWLHHRPAFLEFGLVVLGIALGTGLGGGLPGFLVGSCSGAWAASWLNQRWGWSGPAYQAEFEARGGYLAVLVSAASADGVISPGEAERVAAVGREIFNHLGYGGEADVARNVASLAAQSLAPEWAARYMAGLAPDLREGLQFEVLRILHADGEPSPPNRDWLDRCMGEAGPAGWPLLRFFDRAAVRVDESRRTWLAELGLGEDADAAAIRAAYRAGAQAYHPDRLGGVPPQVRALAEAKMAALNEAYHRLTTSGAAAGGVALHFRHAEEARSFRPEAGREFHCRCWLCGQLGRVPAHAEPASCRCGACHALTGLAFDPTAA